MELSIYSVICNPRVTIKAYDLNQKFQKLVLDVHPMANKPMIAEALKKLFNVEAEEIRTIVVKGKRRRVGRHIVVGKKRKKAIVTLKKGQDLQMGVQAPAVYTGGSEEARTEA